MPIIIEDGHPQVRRITLKSESTALLTSRVLANTGQMGYFAVVVGVVTRECAAWGEVKAFLEEMGITDAPVFAPESDLIRDSVVN